MKRREPIVEDNLAPMGEVCRARLERRAYDCTVGCQRFTWNMRPRPRMPSIDPGPHRTLAIQQRLDAA